MTSQISLKVPRNIQVSLISGNIKFHSHVITMESCSSQTSKGHLLTDSYPTNGSISSTLKNVWTLWPFQITLSIQAICCLDVLQIKNNGGFFVVRASKTGLTLVDSDMITSKDREEGRDPLNSSVFFFFFFFKCQSLKLALSLLDEHKQMTNKISRRTVHATRSNERDENTDQHLSVNKMRNVYYPKIEAKDESHNCLLWNAEDTYRSVCITR